MPPKAAAKSDSKAAAKAAGEAPAADVRKQLSNMVTQLATPKANEVQKQTLEVYHNLPRFSQVKHDILAKWEADNSCAWMNSFSQSMSSTTENQSSMIKGFGTMWMPYDEVMHHAFVMLCCVLIALIVSTACPGMHLVRH